LAGDCDASRPGSPAPVGVAGEEVAVRSDFNADFYVAAATVIPVLYLALGVQGSMLTWVIARLNKSLRAMSRQRPDTPLRQLALAGRVAVSYVLMTVALLILAAGVVGESAAILALYHQKGGPTTGRLVTASVIALLVLTAASPAWALILAWPRMQWIPLKHAWWIVTHLRKGADVAEPDWVRRANAGDLPSVQEVVAAAYAKYLDRMDRPPAPLLTDYRAVLAAGDLWVAGRPVAGLIVLTQSGDSLHVDNVAVHPSAQGTGLGRQLMEFAEQQAQQRGLRRLTLYTHEVMVENQLIYAHFGYREVYRRTENGYRRVYMEKLLPPRAGGPPTGEPGS
jgi:GNAT superfamily N-acetyltransferase